MLQFNFSCESSLSFRLKTLISKDVFSVIDQELSLPIHAGELVIKPKMEEMTSEYKLWNLLIDLSVRLFPEIEKLNKFHPSIVHVTLCAESSRLFGVKRE